MIKNRSELLDTIPLEAAHKRRLLLDVVDYTLEKIMPKYLLKGALKGRSLKPFKRIGVFALGKAARTMTEALIPLLNKKPDFVVIADKGHPLPTAEGVKKSAEMMKHAAELSKDDLAIVLISGGGSAMCVQPVSAITLEDKIKTNEALIKSGAPIEKMNMVRKHLSQIKGGNLAKLLYPATVWGFVISDVMSNDLSTIASGPLSPDPSTFKDALTIIKKYKVSMPLRVRNYLEKGLTQPELETPKPGEKYFKKVKISIIADHSTAAHFALEKAKKMKLKVRSLGVCMKGEARNVVKTLIKKGMKDTLIIGCGETTVTCKGHGYGGRNQEFVLSGINYLKPNQTLLSIGTDGIDGMCPEPIAGALADSEVIKNARTQALSIKPFLHDNDSYTFFKQTKGLIKTGTTGTNLGDLMLLYTE